MGVMFEGVKFLIVKGMCVMVEVSESCVILIEVYV